VSAIRLFRKQGEDITKGDASNGPIFLIYKPGAMSMITDESTQDLTQRELCATTERLLDIPFILTGL